jgi:hypothetical protein
MDHHHAWTSRAWRLGIVLPLVMAAFLQGSPAGAQDGPETPHLSLGPWSGVGEASGAATASVAGAKVTWDGPVRADLNVNVEGDTNVSGQWSHQGSAIMTIDGSFQGHQAHLNGDLTFSGPGTVGGDSQVLTLDGTSHTVGTVTASSGQGSASFPVDTQDTIPTMKVTIQFAECDEAYGNFVWAVEQAFQGIGFSTDLQGSLMLERDTKPIQEQMKQLEGIFAGGPAPESTNSPLFDAIAHYVADVNALTEAWPNWSMDQVMDDLAKAEEFLNTLRNLRPCVKRFVGEDNVEYFAQALTFQIQQLIIGGSQLEDLTGDNAFKLMQVATRVGAFGPGASNPAQAVKAEEALRTGCERILEQNVDPSSGLIKINEDTQKAMLTGAIMDWSFDVAGLSYSARDTYRRTGYDWQQDGKEVEAGQ